MKRNEILGEHKKGTKAVKYNKKPKDHAAEFGKAKEKLAPVKPMEGYNPNSAGAEHRRKLDQSHAADLKARAEGPDATERDQQRYQNYLDRKEQMRNDYNDRMEREGVGHDRTTHRGGKITATSRGIKHEKTDYEDDNIVFKRKDDDEANPSRYKKYAILDPDDNVDEGRWDRRDAYQRDYDSSQRGMGRRDFGYDDAGYSLAPGHDEGEPVYSRAHDRIGHGGPTARREPAADVPHDVYIDGRKWKTFGSASHASNVARKLQANGKSVSVKASPTDEAMGAEVGKITKVDPTTKKATLTKTDGSSMEVDSTALKPTPDGKMSMDTPDADELKMGTAVVSTENVDLYRLRELSGQPVAEGGITLPNPDGSLPPGAFTAAGQEKLNKMVGDKMNAPANEKDLGNGFTLTTTEFEGKSLPAVLDPQDKTYWIEKPAGTGTKYGMSSYIKIQNGKADGKMPGDQTVDAMKAAGWKAASTSSPRPSPEPSANEPFVPRDYQTKEPLTKGPDGNWRNSKGEARDGLHGGPVTAQGTAQFRSMTPRTPTPESADNQLLQKMLSIAGLK